MKIFLEINFLPIYYVGSRLSIFSITDYNVVISVRWMELNPHMVTLINMITRITLFLDIDSFNNYIPHFSSERLS